MRPLLLLAVVALLATRLSAASSLADERLVAIVAAEQELGADGSTGEGLLAATQSVVDRYENFIEDEPEHLFGRILFGKFLNRIGRSKGAAVQLLAALEIDPGPAVVHQQLGVALTGAGRPLEALPFFIGATEREPETAVYHYGLGTYLFTYRELLTSEGVLDGPTIEREMLTAFRRAFESEPENLDYAMRYGEAFYDLAEPDWITARAHWRALRLRTPDRFLRQVFALQEARVEAEAGNPDAATALLEGVTLPSLQQSADRVRKAVQTSAKSPDNNPSEN